VNTPDSESRGPAAAPSPSKCTRATREPNRRIPPRRRPMPRRRPGRSKFACSATPGSSRCCSTRHADPSHAPSAERERSGARFAEARSGGRSSRPAHTLTAGASGQSAPTELDRGTRRAEADPVLVGVDVRAVACAAVEVVGPTTSIPGVSRWSPSGAVSSICRNRDPDRAAPGRALDEVDRQVVTMGCGRWTSSVTP
jgi:hypothetical protein